MVPRNKGGGLVLKCERTFSTEAERIKDFISILYLGRNIYPSRLCPTISTSSIYSIHSIMYALGKYWIKLTLTRLNKAVCVYPLL